MEIILIQNSPELNISGTGSSPSGLRSESTFVKIGWTRKKNVSQDPKNKKNIGNLINILVFFQYIFAHFSEYINCIKEYPKNLGGGEIR